MAEKEYIERGAALAVIAYNPIKKLTEPDIVELTLLTAQKQIRKVPAADVTEVRHGEWITKGENGLLICSECGTNRPFDVQGDKIEYWQGNFCNICGAKMDGERKEQK